MADIFWLFKPGYDRDPSSFAGHQNTDTIFGINDIPNDGKISVDAMDFNSTGFNGSFKPKANFTLLRDNFTPDLTGGAVGTSKQRELTTAELTQARNITVPKTNTTIVVSLLLDSAKTLHLAPTVVYISAINHISNQVLLNMWKKGNHAAPLDLVFDGFPTGYSKYLNNITVDCDLWYEPKIFRTGQTVLRTLRSFQSAYRSSLLRPTDDPFEVNDYDLLYSIEATLVESSADGKAQIETGHAHIKAS